jgi:XTP/dITP diphosphohydrolase
MILCFATNNAHKLAEVQDMLQNGEITLKTLRDIGCTEELPETTDTIEGNSAQKAEYVWQHYGVGCFADDSGLEVEALGGAPGVHSAHYSGERHHAKNIELVLQQMQGQSNRAARFKAVITLVLDGTTAQFEGIINGHLLDAPRGEDGFGYDPIFVPEGHTRTFAEMSMAEKSQLSHRARALEKLVAYLGGINTKPAVL